MIVEERKNVNSLNNIIQNLVLENRNKLSISGVKDVLSFDDQVVIMETELGLLTIKGENLKINKLSIDTQEVIVEGEINNLGYSDHSKKELTDKIKRTCDEESAEKAVERMEELGLVNDENFARRYAEQLLFSKHNAPRGAVRQLVQKGIDRELAEEIIEEIDFDPCDGIRAVIDRKYKNINDEKIRRRAVAALQRLGYGWDDIKTVLREYTEED